MRLICSSHRLLVLPVFVSLAMQCFGEKKIFEIHVKQSNESLGTRKVELDTNNLVAMGLKGDDMTRIIGILDDKGEIVHLLLDGHVIPSSSKVNKVTTVLYNYPGPHNTTIQVTRDYFANRTMQEIRDDASLVPLVISELSQSNPPPILLINNKTCVEVFSGRNGTYIILGDNYTVLHEEFQSSWIKRNSLTVLTKPEGLFLRVVSLNTGKVVLESYASTIQPSAVQEMLETLITLSDGYLVTMTTLIDSTASISSEERAGLEALGSSMVQTLKFLDVWCWVWITGGATLLESVSQARTNTSAVIPLIAAPLLAHVDGINTLTETYYPDCQNDPAFSDRIQFCREYAGYKELCDCEQPSIVEPTSRLDSWRERIAVLVMTRTRPRYLYRLFRELLSQPGLQRRDILCCVDGSSSKETLSLLKLLNISTVVHKPEGTTSNGKIARHMRFTLFTGQRLFSSEDVDKFIILEDDLIPAPDFYSYMQQTSALLDRDPTIYAVSAYNAQAFSHTAHNTSRLYRDDSFPAYGWMVKKAYIEEILPMWPAAYSNYDWDFWMGSSLVRLNRSVVVPEVPRVRHGGLTGGAHMAGTEAVYLLREKPVTSHVDNTVDIESVIDSNYELESQALLKRAKPLNLSDTQNQTFPTEGSGDVYMISISSHYEDDQVAFRVLAHSLGIWCRDSRGSRNGLWRIPYYNNTLLIIAVPWSKYSKTVAGRVKFTISSAQQGLEDVGEEMRQQAHFAYDLHAPQDYMQILFPR